MAAVSRPAGNVGATSAEQGSGPPGVANASGAGFDMERELEALLDDASEAEIELMRQDAGADAGGGVRGLGGADGACGSEGPALCGQGGLEAGSGVIQQEVVDALWGASREVSASTRGALVALLSVCFVRSCAGCSVDGVARVSSMSPAVSGDDGEAGALVCVLGIVWWGVRRRLRCADRACDSGASLSQRKREGPPEEQGPGVFG